MRVLLLSMDYPPRMAGGTTIHTWKLATSLSPLVEEVHVVSADGSAPSEEEKEGVLIHRVRRPFTFFSAVRIRKLLRSVDIVHGHGTCTFGHILLNQYPTVLKMHNTWLAERRRYLWLKEKGEITKIPPFMRLYERMDKFCSMKADHLICVSGNIAREVMEYGVDKENLTVIHNGVDHELFQSKKDLRDKFGLHGVVVGYVGRLEPHKGVKDLVAVSKSVRASFLIVGDGSQRNELERMVNELGLNSKFHFAGYVPYDRIASYYNTADIIVYPSHYEPLGNVVLEGMASGKPVIASRVGGIPEILEEGCGILFRVGDLEQLKKALRTLTADPELRRRMGEKGRKVSKQYSWGKVAKQTLDVLRGVLSSYS